MRDGPGDGGWRDGMGEGEERGGFARFVHRVLENPSNPLGWSLWMFRLWGIDVRIHLVTVIFFVGSMLASLGLDYWGPSLMAVAMGAVFGLVLIHEFGHCLACRWAGGEADRIVMLPFGGLALTRPVASWRAHLITTVGGPAVHVPIFVLTSLALGLSGFWDLIVFKPWDPSGALGSISLPGRSLAAWGVSALWAVHYTNVLLFCFNMLLVFFPFDGGRIVQAVLWRKMGYRRSMTFAVHLGLAGAVLVGVVALVFGQVMLVAIAFFGGIACWNERQRLQMVDEVTGFAPGELDGEISYAGSMAGGSLGAFGGGDGDDDEREDRREAKRRERERLEQDELDRVLEKISQEGKGALTRRERKFLETQTAKRREGGV